MLVTSVLSIAAPPTVSFSCAVTLKLPGTNTYKIYTSHTVMVLAFHIAQVHVCVITDFVHFSVDGSMR